MIIKSVLLSAVLVAQVARPQVPGVSNFAKVGATIACAGAVTPAGVAEVKKLGYASIINLREAGEAGADVEAEMAAAKSAGLIYVHLPFNGAAPDSAIVDQFLQVVTERANQPVLVHCASGNRAAALWMIKRLVVDGWDEDRAAREASDLGLTSASLKVFVLDYATSHRR